MKLNIGLYNLYMIARGGGEKRTLVLADHLSRKHNVSLLVKEPLDLPALENYFEVDLRRIKVVVMEQTDFLSRRLAAAHHPRAARLQALTDELRQLRQIKSLKLDLFINNSHASQLACPAPRGVYMCMFPHEPPQSPNKTLSYWLYNSLMSQAEKRALGWPRLAALDSYSVITANSLYTSRWIEQMWGRRNKIIFSACDHLGLATHKEKIIVHAGRFAANTGVRLHKRQDVLLEVFKSLPDIHAAGWQLHFAGSTTPDERSRQFTAELVEAARGYPVFFHFDAPLFRLHDLYRKASLYWHATGYGLPADEHPAMQEHFGITTVEAMSAGAVPIVINTGGQREIVSHEVDGFRWDDLDGLVAHTQRLIADPPLLKRISRRAALSSARFSRAAFNASMDRIIEELLPGNPASNATLN